MERETRKIYYKRAGQNLPGLLSEILILSRKHIIDVERGVVGKSRWEC